jgi:hypothetical protein
MKRKGERRSPYISKSTGRVKKTKGATITKGGLQLLKLSDVTGKEDSTR